MKLVLALHPEPKLWEQTAKIDDYPQPYSNLQWDTTIANNEHTLCQTKGKKTLPFKTNTGQASCQVNRCGRTSHMMGMLRVFVFFVFLSHWNTYKQHAPHQRCVTVCPPFWDKWRKVKKQTQTNLKIITFSHIFHALSFCALKTLNPLNETVK